jgi:hypothetical protein
MYVWVCVCMFVCMYACVHVRMYVCMHAHACKYVCLCAVEMIRAFEIDKSPKVCFGLGRVVNFLRDIN